MADPDTDHGLVYIDDGIIDITHSPFFDTDLGGDITVDEYADRVCFLLTETIEAQLGINYWPRTLHPDATLHPLYTTLQRGLSSRSIQHFGTVVHGRSFSFLHRCLNHN